MSKIIIKDIEELNQKKQQIIELQKKIEELNEVKLLKEKRRQESELNNKIKELSTFDSKLIGDVIAKLMTEFEGILYQCVKNDSWFRNNDEYLIEPESNDRNIHFIYSNYKLKQIKPENNSYHLKENDSLSFLYRLKKINTEDTSKEKISLSFLPPSSFMSNSESKKESEDINDSYIQYFIDFLYERRSSSSLYKMTSEELENILQEFLLITKDLQQQRRKEITRKIEERLQYEKRLEFENSCLIDRKLMYNSLSYIINNYEENMLATQEYKESWSRSNQWSELYGYHNLVIKNGEKKICFEALVDCDGCYPDEEYCGLYVNKNKDTNICFFDFKKSIKPIIKNSLFIEKFMNMIEDLYNENRRVLSDDIQQILVIISNDRKAQKRVLKKEK